MVRTKRKSQCPLGYLVLRFLFSYCGKGLSGVIAFESIRFLLLLFHATILPIPEKICSTILEKMLGKDASRQNIKALHETRAMRQWTSDMSSTSLLPENCAGARGWRGGGVLQAKKESMIYDTQHLIFLDC